MSATHWNRATLETRIADAGTHQRHAGGSPDRTEIAAYDAALGLDCDCSGTALVLGMTPELRLLAIKRFARLVTVDSNPHAIALYRDWVQPANQKRETIVEADWFSLPAVVTQPVSAVLADGVFGNLPDSDAHVHLLDAIAAVLSPTGRFATRVALIPDGFDPTEHRAERLLQRFRAREIDDAEFGFGIRLVGHYETCYDPRTGRLDNLKLFAQCDARHAVREFTDTEHAAIRRYYFGGVNCILSQRSWEHALTGSDWEFQIHRSRGKTWYEYYPIYSCRLNRRNADSQSAPRRVRWKELGRSQI
jgi:hypothetical protein